MSTFYLTTPIYYPNARPHVGSAYTTIVCDVLARYKRMCGYDVAFLTGTDEHGEKLQRAADAAAIPVEKFVAEKRELFKDLWRTLGIGQYDPERPADYGYRFVHTSQNPAHVKAVHWMIRQADRAGYIGKKKYEGRYCVFDERYVSDGPEPANCDICGRPAELISEENYFFKLSTFGPSEPGRDDGPLMTLYREHPEFVQPDFRMNEVKSFVKGGLRDISISRRRLKWGIPWPDDPEQVVYVWYDALTSYLTGLGFEGDQRSKDVENYWMNAVGPLHVVKPPPLRQVVHMIGKDILRFHAVYWPAFLMAANLPLPTTVFAHGWIYYEQDKMSKSKGNVVYPEPIVQALDSFGAPGNDALRYYLLREAPFGQDTSFSYEALIERYNSDLANGLGNLVNRTVTMIERYFDGLVPNPPAESSEMEAELIAVVFGSPGAPGVTGTVGQTQAFRLFFDRLNLGVPVATLAVMTSWGNKYLADREPWKLAESTSEHDRSLLGEVLYTAADLLRALTILLFPIAPTAAKCIWTQLGCEEPLEAQNPGGIKWGALKPGTRVGKPEPIFPRLDKAKTVAKLHELAEADRSQAVSAQQSAVSSGQSSIVDHQSSISKIAIDDFAKVEMVVGQILAAEAIAGAKKLLKLQVDVGTETRQVCAGIAEYYKPEELVGMKIVLVANLEPRKLRGVESNGMVVAASAGPEAKPVLATFKEDVPNGTRLK